MSSAYPQGEPHSDVRNIVPHRHLCGLPALATGELCRECLSAAPLRSAADVVTGQSSSRKTEISQPGVRGKVLAVDTTAEEVSQRLNIQYLSYLAAAVASDRVLPEDKVNSS